MATVCPSMVISDKKQILLTDMYTIKGMKTLYNCNRSDFFPHTHTQKKHVCDNMV